MTAHFRAMLLGLLRDRGALVMSFGLPIVFFLVFATIFGSASGEHLRLKIALADELRSDESSRLVAGLRGEVALAISSPLAASASQVREAVRLGTADVGLVIRREAEPFGSVGGFGAAPILVIADPARGVAAQMLAGIVQRAYVRALPDAALRGVASFIDQEFFEFSPEERRKLEDGLASLRKDSLGKAEPRAAGVDDLIEREEVLGRSARANHVSYYAGAVAVLFLLFSMVHGALTLFDEEESGLLDRVLSGPGGMGALIRGKFLFLAAQGAVQVAIIFAVAWLVYDVDVPGHALSFLLVTMAAAAAAAGLALALVTACRTRLQAQTLANVAILIVSALGGSMVPRFFMPESIQKIGWLTPTTWALEAYSGIFWRGEPLSALARPMCLLGAAAIAGVAVARRLARRFEAA